MKFTKKRVEIEILKDETEKVWEISLDGEFVCYIDRDDYLKEYRAFVDIDSEFICGGPTLKECMESLERFIKIELKKMEDLELNNNKINSLGELLELAYAEKNEEKITELELEMKKLIKS